MMRRRNFTLLEVLIALSLSAIIMTSLLFFYRYLSEMSAAVNRIEVENFQNRMVQSRLAQVFYQIEGEPFKVNGKGKKEVKKPPQKGTEDKKDANPNADQKDNKPAEKDQTIVFFTGDDEGILKPDSSTLTFIFDNGPSINTLFANKVLAKLFVDKDHRLIIAMWPHPKLWGTMKPPMNLEVLMENVEAISMKFFVPPMNEQKEENQAFPELKPNSWVDSWRREYGQIPALIRVEVVTKDQQGRSKATTFAYPLIDKSKVIEYLK